MFTDLLLLFPDSAVILTVKGVQLMSGTYTIPQLQAVLFPVFQTYNVKKAILFGSYGKGTPTERSDVDLLVDSGLHGLRFIDLLEDVQQAVGKEVDLFDVSHIVPGSEMDQDIRLTGTVIYES